MNTRGLGQWEKRKDVLLWLRDKQYSVVCLQDVHWGEFMGNKVISEWGGEVFFSSYSTNSRGVAILMRQGLDFTLNKQTKDQDGNLLGINIDICQHNISIFNLYGPNRDSPSFYEFKLDGFINELSGDINILCGDWNLVLDQAKDTYGYLHDNNKTARTKVKGLLEIHDLVDAWRLKYPDRIQFTWKNAEKSKFSRLDFFLITSPFYPKLEKVEILPGYRTDHSRIVCNFKLSSQERGKGFWKFNTSLLQIQEYTNAVKVLIGDVAEEYNKTNNNGVDVSEDNNDIMFWEVLKMKIRAHAIKFGSHLKKKKIDRQRYLEKNIQTLELGLHYSRPEIINLYNKYIDELEIYRKEQIEGAIIRSRTKWHEFGDVPSKYFCGLEKSNHDRKLMSKLTLPDGAIITDQKLILEKQTDFYKTLYTSSQTFDNLDYQRMKDYIDQNTILSLPDEEQDELNADISIDEVAAALKNMKDNKSPGTDGLPVEFYRFFWNEIGPFFNKSIQASFIKQRLSINQRRSIITCIPKANKDITQLKNWRPISLLNTDYKLLSNVISRRLKKHLPNLIHPDQKGFIKGRCISENTRLIYDIISYLDSKNIPGLLFLIDFEKAFDSIEWAFIEYTLKSFNLGNNFIRWFNILYKYPESCVLNNGVYSQFFAIHRGCRQGDPISPYLFILASEILANSIRNNPSIKGINIKNKEFKLGQYADDTFLLLDGNKDSLYQTISCLDQFKHFSGLKVNKEKCQAVWLGRYKNRKDVLSTDFKWVQEFTLLGITFSVNLSKMEEINISDKVINIQKLLASYSKRNLSLLGKVTVIKSLAIPKLVHVLSVIRTPSAEYVKRIETLFQNFIWSNKSTRIKYQFLSNTIENGGLNIPHLLSLSMAWKMSWVKKSYSLDGAWQNLFSITIDHPELVWTLDPISLKRLA